MKLSSQTGKVTHVLFILIVSLAAYLNSFLHVDFLMDDWDLIVNNPQINHPQYLLYAFFPSLNPEPVSLLYYYRPLALITVAVSHWICGFNVGGYILINWILFYLVCLSVYFFVQAYFQDSSLALMTALLFTVHPFNGFMVNYISASVFALQMICLCWAAIFFKFFNDQPKKIHYLTASLILFILALLCHDDALAFPLFLLTLNVLAMKNNAPLRSLPKIFPYIIISSIFYVIKVNCSNAIHNILNNEVVSLLQYVASVAKLMMWHTHKLLTGADTVFIWATRTVTMDLAWWGIISLAIILLCVVGYLSSKVHPVIRLAAGWFLLSTLLVAAGCRFEPVHGWIIEPHWLYFSSIASFAAVSLFFLKLRDIFPKIVFSSIFAVYLGTLLLNNWSLNNLWANERKYCAYWAKQAPGFATPLSYLASAYIREGNLAKGEEILKEALKGSDQEILLYKLGMIYYMREQWDEAARYLQRALALDPNSGTLRSLLEDIDKKKAAY